MFKLDFDTDNGEVYAILIHDKEFTEFMQSCPDRIATPTWTKSGQFDGAGLYCTECLPLQNHVIYRKAYRKEAKELQAKLRELSWHLRDFANAITTN